MKSFIKKITKIMKTRQYQLYILSLLTILLSLTLCGCFNHYDLAEVDSLGDLDSAKQATIKVVNSHSDTILGSSLESQNNGTGFVFSEDDEYYYALTNNHVIYTSAWNNTITVTNYAGESVSARVLKKSATYDCAIITFKKSITCSIMPLATQNPAEGDTTCIIDQDFGHYDGQVLTYTLASKLDNKSSSSKVKCDIFTSNSYTHNGSSGAPVLDSHYNVIGMVYASDVADSSNNHYCCVIPVEKIRKFIK